MVWDTTGNEELQQEQKQVTQGVNAVMTLDEDGEFLQEVREATGNDDYHKHNRFLVEGPLINEGLFHLGRLLYVPSSLCQRIIAEAHESTYSGHVGVDKTTAAVRRRFWWPHLRRNIRAFVKQCDECQKNKLRTQLKYGPLNPIPPPTRP